MREILQDRGKLVAFVRGLARLTKTTNEIWLANRILGELDQPTLKPVGPEPVGAFSTAVIKLIVAVLATVAVFLAVGVLFWVVFL